MLAAVLMAAFAAAATPPHPGSTDADGDRLVDGAEVALGSDPARLDSDGDGSDDLTELVAGDSPLGHTLRDFVRAAGSEPTPHPRIAAAGLSDDTDGDGLPDDLEPLFGCDPTDADTDDDGFGDTFEVIGRLQWGLGEPADPDHDDDGIDDLHDDFDEDGLANDIELASGTNIYVADSDHDGLDDAEEGALGSSPLIRDSDGNGVRDSDEDADDDGLGLAQERSVGTDPMQPDTDGDELSDGDEIALCTDPLAADIEIDVVCLGRSTAGVPDWKLFQRGPDGAASIPVPFRYRLAHAGRLEAAVVSLATGAALRDHGYGDHVATLPASTGPGGADGVLLIPAVPQGGNYDVRVRLVDATTGAIVSNDVARSLAVGDVFLAAGQSNMTGNNGWAEPPSLLEAPHPSVHLFGNDGRWKMGSEPMDDPANSLDDVSIDGLARSSPMLRFAKEVALATGIPVAIIPAAHSGSTLLGPLLAGPSDNSWIRDPDDAHSRATLYGSAVSRVLSQDYDQPIRGVIWYQGESDIGQTTAAYRDGLTRFVADLRSDLGAAELFFASCQLAWRGTTHPGTQEGWIGIQEAQRQYAAGDSRSVLVGTADLPADGLHLLGPGYREAGRRLAMATLRVAYRMRADRTPLLRRTRLQRHGMRIALSFDRRVAGGDPALFRMVDGTNVVEAVAASVRGRRVVVDLAGATTASARLTYGLGLMPPLSPIVGARGEGAALVFQGLPMGVKLP